MRKYALLKLGGLTALINELSIKVYKMSEKNAKGVQDGFFKLLVSSNNNPKIQIYSICNYIKANSYI